MKRILLVLAALALLAGGCQRELTMPPPTRVGQAQLFADGPTLTLWEDIFGNHSYQLPDGTELLNVRAAVWPWDSHVGGCEGFDGLTPEAQRAVRGYFERQGLLYDLDSLLSDAYADYRACQQENTPFLAHMIGQEIIPTGETEGLSAFCALVIRPKCRPNNGNMVEERTAYLFDRTTGAPLSAWEAFRVPEAQARQALAAWSAYEGSPPRQALAQALRPEYLFWYGERLDICYPAGSLPDMPDGMTTGVPYGELTELLQPWALPQGAADQEEAAA